MPLTLLVTLDGSEFAEQILDVANRVAQAARRPVGEVFDPLRAVRQVAEYLLAKVSHGGQRLHVVPLRQRVDPEPLQGHRVGRVDALKVRVALRAHRVSHDVVVVVRYNQDEPPSSSAIDLLRRLRRPLRPSCSKRVKRDTTVLCEQSAASSKACAPGMQTCSPR